MKWLEFMYPTDVATKVFYRGRVIESVAGGQQGYPMIGACHAVTNRLLHEALGLVEPLQGSAVQLPVLVPPAQVDMSPSFADDGLTAGKSSEVLRALRHLQWVMPQVGLSFSTLQEIPTAGSRHAVNMEDFKQLGCTICEEGTEI